jgi:addiction module RelB/DinJ family antitoxin
MVVAENLGFTTSTLIKLFLANVVQNRKIPFEIEEIPSANFIKVMKQAELDHKNGNYSSFNDMEDAIDFLKKSIRQLKSGKKL